MNEPDLCSQLARWGHLVVTHTDNHVWLPWLDDPANNDPNKEQRLINEVLNGVSNIGAATNPDSLLLRPPYGAWDENVANVLNTDTSTRKFIGPIMGDIGAYDWMFWDNAAAPANTPQTNLPHSEWVGRCKTARTNIMPISQRSEKAL